jgi:hypothetical protein
MNVLFSCCCSRIYALRSAPATMKAIFRFSDPILREDALLPDRKKEALKKQKEASLKANLLKPFYRFRKKALDLHRQRVAVPDPLNYYDEVGAGGGEDGFDDIGNGMDTPGKNTANTSNPHVVHPFKGNPYENSTVKCHGPPRTPTNMEVGYGNTRFPFANANPAHAEKRKGKFYAIKTDNVGEDSETLTWADIDARMVPDGPESLELKRQYKHRHKTAFDRRAMVQDIEDKFIAGVEVKSRFDEYYPHITKNKKNVHGAYDEYGNRIEKAFNFHSEHFDEVTDPGLFAPQRSLSSSRQHYNDGGTLNGTDPFVRHFPSMTDFSSSAPEDRNLHNSQYLAQEEGCHFVNDNETHNASRGSDLSMNSMESRFHIPVRMQRQRKVRGYSKYHLKSGIKLMSRRGRDDQRTAKEEHRKELEEKEETRQFLASRKLHGMH